jgi:hypothetical protein
MPTSIRKQKVKRMIFLKYKSEANLFIIYLSRVLYLCVCVCVCVSERSAILLVLAIKLTKETRRRVSEGGIRDGEIGDGKIMEGGCEETFHCLILTNEKCRFTEPPAVVLLN